MQVKNPLELVIKTLSGFLKESKLIYCNWSETKTDVQQHDKTESLPASFTTSPPKICSQQQLNRKLSLTETESPNKSRADNTASS